MFGYIIYFPFLLFNKRFWKVLYFNIYNRVNKDIIEYNNNDYLFGESLQKLHKSSSFNLYNFESIYNICNVCNNEIYPKKIGSLPIADECLNCKIERELYYKNTIKYLDLLVEKTDEDYIIVSQEDYYEISGNPYSEGYFGFKENKITYKDKFLVYHFTVKSCEYLDIIVYTNYYEYLNQYKETICDQYELIFNHPKSSKEIILTIEEFAFLDKNSQLRKIEIHNNYKYKYKLFNKKVIIKD